MRLFTETPLGITVSEALNFKSPLRDFEAIDLSGHVWRASDLRGRMTVVWIWSTAGPPFWRDLPTLQAFYENVKTGNAIRVLTFNLDQDETVVRQFIRKHGYSFPVIVNRAVEFNVFPQEGSVPKIWVIDRQGRRCEPFEQWSLGRILIEVERATRQ